MVSRKTSIALMSTVLFFTSPVLASATQAASDAGVEGASGGGPVFWMDAGVEAWSGDITYQIGFPVTDANGFIYSGYFPFSELTFPLDATFGSVEAGAIILDRYALRLRVKKNVSDPGDDMEDRDWLTDANPGRLDVFSNSEVTDFSATVIDVDATYRYPVHQMVVLSGGIGYMYQDFEYDTAVRRQWSPSGLPGFDYVGDGRTSLIYEVDCEIPYLVFGAQLNIAPSFILNGRFAYAPWVDVDDTDQHLLRNKVNRGDLDGSAVMVSVDGEFDITSQFFVSGGLDYTYIEADGEMDASFYGIYDHTVTEEFESSQTAVYARFGFRFGVPGTM